MKFLFLICIFGVSTIAAAAPSWFPPYGSVGSCRLSDFNLEHFVETKGLPEAAGCGVSGTQSLFNRVIRGGVILTQEGAQCLRQQGVVAVVDLRGRGEVARRSESQWLAPLGIEYAQFPMSVVPVWGDACGNSGSAEVRNAQNSGLFESTEAQARAAVQKIKQVLLANPNGKVYVHCTRGEDRTGLVLGMLRAQLDQCNKSVAREEMRRYFYTPYCNLQKVWDGFIP